MRSLLMLTCLLPTLAFAISCPSNGRILDTGYTIDQALQLCGQPMDRKDYNRLSTASEKWTYYRQASGNNNDRITFIFNQSRVANVRIIHNGRESNVSSTGICGALITTGTNTAFVRSACGQPAEEQTLAQNVLPVTELHYSSSGFSTLVFENSMLVDWK